MRIGIDGSCLANRRGFGRFARLLLDAIARNPGPHRYVVIIDGPSADSVVLPEGMDRVVVDVSDAPSRAASASGRRSLGDLLAMGRAAARSGLDLLYFPATYTFYPVWKVPRVVVTMHDTLALAHPDLVFPTRRGRLAWLLKEHAAARWADRIVTVSETSRRDLQHWFRLPPQRLRVIGEGPAPVFRPLAGVPAGAEVLERYRIPPEVPFLLYVGGLSPHKNLPRLIEAFARIADRSLRLVLVGDLNDVFHTQVPEIRAAIARHGLEQRVVLPGFVPDAELVHLYSRAYALVQPSLMEGFGLPAVEAMACGTPVISSRAGSLPEVVGDAGIYFDPRSVPSMVEAIDWIATDPTSREQLARRALDRSLAFSWDRAARSLIACFEELGISGSTGPNRPRSGRGFGALVAMGTKFQPFFSLRQALREGEPASKRGSSAPRCAPQDRPANAGNAASVRRDQRPSPLG
jgi:glycosyltransferase involved in cell wall biosynthesis